MSAPNASARIGEALRGHVGRGTVAGAVALVARRDAVHVEVAGVQTWHASAGFTAPAKRATPPMQHPSALLTPQELARDST